MKEYIRRHAGYLLLPVLLCAFYHCYFFFFLTDGDRGLLLYADVLCAVAYGVFAAWKLYGCHMLEKKKQEYLKEDGLIVSEFKECAHMELAKHDRMVLQKQLDELRKQNDDLQDYVTKWVHEVKLPLSAAFLIEEKLEDECVREELKEQLERIRQQLNAALLGCRLQGRVYDVSIRRTSLRDCVYTALKNQQFFLLKEGFELDIQVADHIVYTDKEWLVYALDQLLSNAVKYVRKPVLHIRSEQRKDAVYLYVRDEGEGIRKEDLHRIFEKGFTGGNHHNGKHRSTGMGLYMVSLVMDKLQHAIQVESEENDHTQFTISFRDNRSFFSR